MGTPVYAQSAEEGRGKGDGAAATQHPQQLGSLQCRNICGSWILFLERQGLISQVFLALAHTCGSLRQQKAGAAHSAIGGLKAGLLRGLRPWHGQPAGQVAQRLLDLLRLPAARQHPHQLAGQLSHCTGPA